MTLQKDDSAFIVRVMMTFDQAADDYLGDCERRGFRPRSVATYRRTYTQFADRLPAGTDVSKIATDDVRRFLNSKNRLAHGTRAGIEAHLGGLFAWLLREGKIAKNPMLPIARTRRIPSEDLDVTTVSTEEVRRMLAAAQGWTERICLGVLVYTGVRRHAASTLRLGDYDELHRRLRFHEKGGKTIWKPVPDELDILIRAAINAGVYAEEDYLIPNRGPRPTGRGERDDRFIWHTVKTVAGRAGVKCHTHALRAAFAVFYLETHKRDTLALQSLMGHKSSNTTQIYLRKLDRQAEMERVRDLSWGVILDGDTPEDAPSPSGPRHPAFDDLRGGVAAGYPKKAGRGAEDVSQADDAAEQIRPQIAGICFGEDRLVGAGGFEPPIADSGSTKRRTANLLDADLAERLNQAVSGDADPGSFRLVDLLGETP